MSDTPTPAQADEKALERALEALRLADAALEDFERYGCPVCGGDCASANPPVYSCPMQACIEARRRIRAALASDASPSGWQDISTAPKDDDVLLATDARVAGGFPQIVYWDIEANNGWHTVDSDLRYHPDFFTHWRRDCLDVPATPPAKEHRHDD